MAKKKTVKTKPVKKAAPGAVPLPKDKVKKKAKKKAVLPPDRELINQSEYARRRGVSNQMVAKYIKSGLLTLVGKKIDPVMADRQLADGLDISQETKESDDLNGLDPSSDFRKPYNQARAVKEGYNAKLAELLYKEKAGLLVSAEEVRRAAATEYRKFRDQMLNIPDRITRQIMEQTDEHKAKAMHRNEIEQAIQREINDK